MEGLKKMDHQPSSHTVGAGWIWMDGEKITEKYPPMQDSLVNMMMIDWRMESGLEFGNVNESVGKWGKRNNGRIQETDFLTREQYLSIHIDTVLK